MATASVQTQTPPFTDREENLRDFAGARLGLFVHYGLYSILGRGEWVLNRELLPVEQYKQLADRFDPSDFDADALVRLARDAGCRYVCFTTMHHDGFALYDSKVNPFNSVNACGRDLTAEVVEACRKYGLRVHLYHSLNDWTAEPDAVAGLESKDDYEKFITFTHERFRELVTRFNPVECLWYDGWWPYSAAGWRSEQMNEMVREIQPHILFNGRNGLTGDFATPEQHVSAPRPWRPWEACVTHNSSWGYHAGDDQFKPTSQVLDLVTRVAANAGNLLLNIGPDATGRIPEPSVKMLRELGQWMAINGEAIYESEPFSFDWQQRYPEDRSDWSSLGRYTARGNVLYFILLKGTGTEVRLAGLEVKAREARLLGSDAPLRLTQEGRVLTIAGLPAEPPHPLAGVVRIECDEPPSVSHCAGLRTPRVAHPPYDPNPSDLPPH